MKESQYKAVQKPPELSRTCNTETYFASYLRNSYALPKDTNSYKGNALDKANYTIKKNSTYSRNQSQNSTILNSEAKKSFSFPDEVKTQPSARPNRETVAVIMTPGLSRNTGASYKTEQKDERRNQLLSKETEKLLMASRKRMQKVRSKLELQNGVCTAKDVEDDCENDYIKILTDRNNL